VNQVLDIPNAKHDIIIERTCSVWVICTRMPRSCGVERNKKAFCYLSPAPMSGLTAEARKRWQTLERNFPFGRWLSKVAMKDLWTSEVPGNLLGSGAKFWILSLICFRDVIIHSWWGRSRVKGKWNSHRLFEVESSWDSHKFLFRNYTISKPTLELLIPEENSGQHQWALGLNSNWMVN